MKSIHFGIISFLILLVSHCYSQIRIINSSLVDTSNNILFEGIENDIRIYGNQSNSYRLISKRNAPINKFSASNFIITPGSGVIDTLLLFDKNKLIHEEIFRINPLPDYILTLGSIKEGLATREQIVLNKRLQVYIPGCKCPPAYVVGFFKLEFISNNIVPYEKFMTIDGNALDEKAISLIKKLSSKDQIIFKDILLRDVGTRSRQIDKFILTIK